MKKSRRKNHLSIFELIKRKILKVISLILLFILIVAILPKAYAQAPIGNFLELFGGHLKATIPADNLPAGFTFEAWVKPDTTTGEQIVLSIGEKASGKFNYELGLSNSSLFFRYRFGTNSTGSLITSGGNLGEVIPDVWNHFSISFSSSSIKLFLNGKESSPVSLTATLFPIGETIVVGDSYLEPSGSTKTFRGKIDEVRISKTVRDIPALWSAGVYNSPLPKDANTVILWHLDEARGVVQAIDSSGNNYTGNLIGGDIKIHFYGVLPTPTPFSLTLPTIRWSRPILPTLSLPTWNSPTQAPAPIIALPTSSFYDIRFLPRPTRPSFR